MLSRCKIYKFPLKQTPELSCAKVNQEKGFGFVHKGLEERGTMGLRVQKLLGQHAGKGLCLWSIQAPLGPTPSAL